MLYRYSIFQLHFLQQAFLHALFSSCLFSFNVLIKQHFWIYCQCNSTDFCDTLYNTFFLNTKQPFCLHSLRFMMLGEHSGFLFPQMFYHLLLFHSFLPFSMFFSPFTRYWFSIHIMNNKWHLRLLTRKAESTEMLKCIKCNLNIIKTAHMS